MIIFALGVTKLQGIAEVKMTHLELGVGDREYDILRVHLRQCVFASTRISQRGFDSSVSFLLPTGELCWVWPGFCGMTRSIQDNRCKSVRHYISSVLLMMMLPYNMSEHATLLWHQIETFQPFSYGYLFKLCRIKWRSYKIVRASH